MNNVFSESAIIMNMRGRLDDSAKRLVNDVKTAAEQLNPVKSGRSKGNWRIEEHGKGEGYVLYNPTHYQDKIEILGWTYTPPYNNLGRAIEAVTGMSIGILKGETRE